MPQRPDLVAKAIPPDYALSSHVAPLGMVFYTGTNLPAAYRGGAFVGEHGSWDRTGAQRLQGGLRAVRQRPARAAWPRTWSPASSTRDNKARGRPVGLAVDASGGLLIADDVGNTVWRVTAATAPK